MLKTLLKGQTTGAPLFLFWSMGVFLAYVLSFLAIQADGTKRVGSLLIILVVLSIWQASLLISIWRKRVLWVSVFATFASLIYLDMEYGTAKASAFPLLFLSQMLQGAVLIRERRRVVIWFLLAILGLGFIVFFAEEGWLIYDRFCMRIPTFFAVNFIPDFLEGFLYFHQVAFGAVAAFFMPPAGKQRRS